MEGFSEVHALFHKEFYLLLADKPAWDSMQARAEVLVATYLSDHPDDLRRVWEVERPFELHLEHANVIGRADVILDREGDVEGALAIVDYKTHKVDAAPEMGLQLQVYTAAGRGEGFDVRAAWLHDLTAKGKSARIPVETDKAAISAARMAMDSRAKGIRERSFEAMPRRSLQTLRRARDLPLPEGMTAEPDRHFHPGVTHHPLTNGCDRPVTTLTNRPPGCRAP